MRVTGLEWEQSAGGVVTSPALAEGTFTGLTPVRPPSLRVITGIADAGISGRLGLDLAWMGCDVFDAADGVQMIRYISDAILDEPGSRRPDLIVADAVSVGCNGLSVLAGIRDLGWTTPVLLLLRRKQMHLYRAAWQMGANGLSVSPHSAEELALMCQQLLEPELEVAARSGADHSKAPVHDDDAAEDEAYAQ